MINALTHISIPLIFLFTTGCHRQSSEILIHGCRIFIRLQFNIRLNWYDFNFMGLLILYRNTFISLPKNYCYNRLSLMYRIYIKCRSTNSYKSCFEFILSREADLWILQITLCVNTISHAVSILLLQTISAMTVLLLHWSSVIVWNKFWIVQSVNFYEKVYRYFLKIVLRWAVRLNCSVTHVLWKVLKKFSPH